jgi:hypothetical protein
MRASVGDRSTRGLAWDANTADRVAQFLLGAPLLGTVAALCGLQLCAWAPHYLTWPMWADHDVFATMAHAWDAGKLPYRDTVSNNFPGTIYLFWVLGRVAGWGNTVAFYAADLLLLMAFGALLLWWSARRFSTLIAGLVAFAAVLTYYLSLDFAHTAQRDWQAPLLCAAAMLLLQTSPTRQGRILSALLSAFALTIRPHVFLFLPALLLAAAGPSGNPITRTRSRRDAILEWVIAFGAFVAIGFLPLVLEGVWGDFSRSIRIAGYGPEATVRSALNRASVLLLPLSAPKLLAAPLAMVALAFGSKSSAARVVPVWLLGFAGALAYDPVSPAWRSYLTEPLWLMWCVHVGIVAGLIAEDRATPPTMRLTALLLLLTFSVVPYPTFCSIRSSVAALTGPRTGSRRPPGYIHNYELPLYKWDDYRAALDYIETQTPADMHVASLLFGVAVTGPTGRLSALPAESATWLDMVDPGDEQRFAQALEYSANSIVVWAPGDPAPPHVRQLFPLVVRLYSPAATFGPIEVWRRTRARPR